jgi:hypothetical protein
MTPEPKTDLEREFYRAVVVLLRNRESLAISLDDFLTLCKAVPAYALRVIDGNRLDLAYHVGQARPEISRMIVTAEWVLKGPSKFIEDHPMVGETEISDFLEARLKTHLHEFSSDDLDALLSTYQRDNQPINRIVLEAMGKRANALADRLKSEPPGLSGDMSYVNRAIQAYGFSPDLNAIQNKIDELLHQTGDGFDQAATMKHIRSFFEKLHESIAKELQSRKPTTADGTPLHQFGSAIDFLERKGVITDKIKNLGRALYAILSDGQFGVHALKANRDYTRLCRNMVVEYSVTLLFELERRITSI